MILRAYSESKAPGRDDSTFMKRAVEMRLPYAVAMGILVLCCGGCDLETVRVDSRTAELQALDLRSEAAGYRRQAEEVAKQIEALEGKVGEDRACRRTCADMSMDCATRIQKMEQQLEGLTDAMREGASERMWGVECAKVAMDVMSDEYAEQIKALEAETKRQRRFRMALLRRVAEAEEEAAKLETIAAGQAKKGPAATGL